MSPSPEVDLSIHNPDYEHGDDDDQALDNQIVHSATDNLKRDFPTPPAETSSQTSYMTPRSSVGRESQADSAACAPLSTRHQSIPLEGDEHEFMGTARSFRERSSGVNTPTETPVKDHKMEGASTAENHDLFVQQPEKDVQMSSPAFQPLPESKHQAKTSIGQVLVVEDDLHIGEGFYRWDLEAASDINVDDLDSLLA